MILTLIFILIFFKCFIAAVEAAYNIMLKNEGKDINELTNSFSEQQIIDCDNINFGCNGGLLKQLYYTYIRF